VRSPRLELIPSAEPSASPRALIDIPLRNSAANYQRAKPTHRSQHRTPDRNGPAQKLTYLGSSFDATRHEKLLPGVQRYRLWRALTARLSTFTYPLAGVGCNDASGVLLQGRRNQSIADVVGFDI
jgi:hypothetical protein